jgi:hypothetical protein
MWQVSIISISINHFFCHPNPSGQMIEKYDAVARQSGARIAVHCGQVGMRVVEVPEEQHTHGQKLGDVRPEFR